MIQENMLVEVRNITPGRVVFSIPELSIRRLFNRGESKKLSVKELRALKYAPGGEYLLTHKLAVQNQAVIEDIGLNVEPEYFWTRAEIVKLLREGSVDELLDTLEFGPRGVVDYIKRLAVDMPIADMSKRQAIYEMTGFDVTRAIEINKIEAQSEETEQTAPSRGRRVPVVAKED